MKKLITDWIEVNDGSGSAEFDHTFTRRFLFIHQRVRLVKYHNLENYPDDIILYPPSTYLFTTDFYPISDNYLGNLSQYGFKWPIVKYRIINYIFGSSSHRKFNSINSQKLWKILDKKYPFFEKLFKDKVRDKKLNELGI